MALVLVMRFAEGLSDRQAAAAVRSRTDWKSALALTDTGFDSTVLRAFRTRLVQGAAEQAMPDALLDMGRQGIFVAVSAATRTPL